MAEPELDEANNERDPAGGPGAAGTSEGEGRRGALKKLVMVGGLAYAGAIAVPAAAFLTATTGRDQTGERWVRVGRLADLVPGVARRLHVVADERDAFTIARAERLGSVWVRREGDRVRALSATCPHLGCSVDLGEDGKSFACPCHASRFGLAGEVEAGPSPRALDAFAVRVADGWVEVDFRRYRQGIADRREVGE